MVHYLFRSSSQVEIFSTSTRVFAVDAAHVHSPASCQGMNPCLLDAHNLGWKLSLVTEGIADERIVDVYNMEREAFARQLLVTTDTAFHALSGGGWFNRIWRLNVIPTIMPFLMNFPFVRSFFFRIISQTAIAYPSSRLSRGPHRAGDRFPMLNVQVDGGKPICCFELFKNVGFYALDFTDAIEGKKIVDDAMKNCGVNLHYFKCVAEDKDMWRMDVKKMIYIVRPDMYIGFSSRGVDKDEIVRYFKDSVLIMGYTE